MSSMDIRNQKGYRLLKNQTTSAKSSRPLPL